MNGTRVAAEERAVAQLATRAAALLGGGVPAASLWALLAAEDADARAAPTKRWRLRRPAAPTPGPAVRIRARLDAGAAVGEAIAAQAEAAGRAWARVRGPGQPGEPGAAWRVLAAAWSLADRTGAPLAGLLRDLAESLQSGVELGQLRDTALAGPRSSARLVLTLPAIGLGFGSLLGTQPLAVLVGSGAGLALLATGLILVVFAVLWSRRLLSAVDGARALPGIELDLLRIALGGGAAPEEAGRRVADALDRYRVGLADLGQVLQEQGSVARVLRTAQLAGVPVRDLLLTEARAARADYRARLATDIERLGVRLMLPLGVCVLPAFIAVGVLPVLISLLGDGLVAGS